MLEEAYISCFLFKTMDEQCTDMSCAMKYNCCQQSDLCPKSKICKPINSLQRPWKRFTCECPDSYHGDNCDQPITATSCQGYAKSSRRSGVDKVVGFDELIYEVYCYFDSFGAWTLVTSYSYENGTENSSKLKTPLSKNKPVSENYLAWIGYRLNKQRMKSIVKNSTLLLFTCDYEKTYDVNKSDHMELLIKDLVDGDIIELSGPSRIAWVKRLKVGGTTIGQCKSAVFQRSAQRKTLHGRSKLYRCRSDVDTNDKNCLNNDANFGIFGNLGGGMCRDYSHKCLQIGSTIQIWFGS